MKNVLIFRGGWNGHNPVETADIIASRLREHGLHVDIFDTQGCLLDPEFKTQYSLVVPVWTMGTLGREHEKALLDAVRGGMACGGWHGGMGDAFRNNTEYQFMVGGQWVAHPGGRREPADGAAGPRLLAVGPEGGWSDYELRMFAACGFETFGLGERTLRTDTACIALLAVFGQELAGRGLPARRG